ncbi:unnamed protein product, partial [Mesorhabditis spiculigera]
MPTPSKGTVTRNVDLLLLEPTRVLLKFLPPKTVQIIGTSAYDVDLAEVALERHVLDIYTSGCSHTISVPTMMVPLLIGRAGSSIQEIRDKSSVEVAILGQKDEKSKNEREDYGPEASKAFEKLKARFYDENGFEFTNIVLTGDYLMISVAVMMISGKLDDLNQGPRRKPVYYDYGHQEM